MSSRFRKPNVKIDDHAQKKFAVVRAHPHVQVITHGHVVGHVVAKTNRLDAALPPAERLERDLGDFLLLNRWFAPTVKPSTVFGEAWLG